MRSRASALALSTHPVPGLGVTAIAVVLAIGVGLQPWRVVVLGVAFLLDQASVGLSNDWIDADRDRAVGRTDKPVAQGRIGVAAVRAAAFATLAASLLLTIPLGWRALLAHAVFLAGAWAYNAGVKKTAFSAVPYLVSFGSLPVVVTLAREPAAFAQGWAVGAGALLGLAAHIANVLPDLDDDARTGVAGFPHRIGRRASAVLLVLALLGTGLLVVLGPASPSPSAGLGAVGWIGLVVSIAVGLLGLVLALGRRPTGLLFRLVIAAALLDVVLLAVGGGAIAV